MKLHALFGNLSNIVVAANVTTNNSGDAPELPGLLEQASSAFTIAELSADKAYMSYRVLEAADDALAAPFIPFKSNHKDNPDHPLWHKLWALFTLEQEEFLRHYGQRQNSEAGFSALKRVISATVRAKRDRARINEALAVVVAYNLTRVVHAMFKLGVAPGFGFKTAA